MNQSDDVLGFSREARRGGRACGLCFDLLLALNEELLAEGVSGDPAELGRRNQAVLSGERPCPLQETCEKYQRALQRGARTVQGEPHQLEFWNLLGGNR